MNTVFKFISAQFISHGAGIIGSFFTITNDMSWYANLIKPEWNPPNWIFGPVWLSLYTLIGIALFIVWNKKRLKGLPLYAFGIQLVLNAAWSIIFFGLQSPLYAFLVILALIIAIVVTIISFREISKIAALLLVPYLAWVVFASYLNYTILTLN